jgi:two-component system chemotaxis response regulator CheB
MPLKVLVTDSSVEVCKAIQSIVNTQSNMRVVGFAHTPFEARQLIKDLEPDVLTLSIEFQKMSGLDFLDKIMKLRPMPVVIISKLSANNSLITEKALKMGATACICKPKGDNLDSIASEIINQIRNARTLFEEKLIKIKNAQSIIHSRPNNHLIAIGASTGGTEAITGLLTQVPLDSPGIVIAQHMPKGFTASFADRLTSLCAIKVSEAKHDSIIETGNAYIAPGGLHLLVQKRAGRYYTMLSDDDAVNLHKPSIDILFESVAENIKHLGIGIILTGMGKDGASGLLKMRKAGAKTFGQDEKTSLVYGMPREAKKIGAVQEVLPLNEIMPATFDYLKSLTKEI